VNLNDILEIKKTFEIGNKKYSYMSLKELEKKGHKSISSMPYSIKILLECVLRQAYIKSLDKQSSDKDSELNDLLKSVESLLKWRDGGDIPFKPARVLMHDFTGVPGVVDLAVMRDAIADLGGDPKKINPIIPVNLIIDHSVQVDWFGSSTAFDYNFKREFERNNERYEFLRWASESFDNFTVVPPATGIIHQVNLEYIANVVMEAEENGELFIFPDTLVGTDSHTVMINGLGVLGWGVGGIEAEAAMLGEPLGIDPNGEPIYLNDIWPDREEIEQIINKTISSELYRKEYSNVYSSNEVWNSIDVKGGSRYNWVPDSTYIRKPTFFDGLTKEVGELNAITSARVLVLLGDSVTTDHISPAGAIPVDSPAAKYLMDRGIKQEDFNTYGSRRGNHEVMIRGTFGNIRIKNKLVPGVEGGYTVHLPYGKQMSIYDAAEKYMNDGVQLIVIAGKDYGMGSSRDWAAKGTVLLGIKAVIAESYERIHRSNLIGMGVVPLQFADNENAESLGLTGKEIIDIEKITEVGQKIKVKTDTGKEFTATARVDTPAELDYLKNRGILHTLLRRMA